MGDINAKIHINIDVEIHVNIDAKINLDISAKINIDIDVDTTINFDIDTKLILILMLILQSILISIPKLILILMLILKSTLIFLIINTLNYLINEKQLNDLESNHIRNAKKKFFNDTENINLNPIIWF